MLVAIFLSSLIFCHVITNAIFKRLNWKYGIIAIVIIVVILNQDTTVTKKNYGGVCVVAFLAFFFFQTVFLVGYHLLKHILTIPRVIMTLTILLYLLSFYGDLRVLPSCH
jgi:hypothetical protein